MTKIKTLRQKVSELSVNAFVAIVVVMFTSFTLYSIKKSNITEERIGNELSVNLKSQVNLFLPSFLLPEQKLGITLLLNRIKEEEELEHILIFKDFSDLPKEFSRCTPNKYRSIICGSNDASSTALIAPLSELNQNYGYILKAKKNSNATNLVGVMQFAGIILLMLGLTFIVIYSYLNRLAAKTIPLALDGLVEWIDSEINGKKNNQINLPFKELEDLKIKITEVFENYSRSRDQAVIGQVTSGIMHDIKTPLQSVVTAMHLVSEKEVGTEKRKQRLENLFNMCSSSIPLIGEIIETTLDGNRNIHINKTCGNIRDTIESSFRITKSFSRARNVEVKFDSPPIILTRYDEPQLVRVLNNLVKNGIEAASSSVSRQPAVRVCAVVENDSVRIIVEDSGEGFAGSPDRLFRAFGTTKTHGTGLGLLISKKIIESHGGTISAFNSSDLGGARMEVTLPLEV